MSTHEHHLTPERRRELVERFREQAAEYERRAEQAGQDGDAAGHDEMADVAADYYVAANALEMGQ